MSDGRANVFVDSDELETMEPATWRLVVETMPRSGAANMAVDQAIAEACAAGDSPPTVRFYAWRPPAVSLGRLQPIADIDEAAGQATAAKIEALGRRALVARVDVSQKSQIEAMVAQARQLGRVDILVNNAGVEKISPLAEVSEADWDRVLTINLKGAFLCSQVVAAAMAADQGGGKIINIGSIAGVMPPKGEPHYAASKAGVHILTKQLALELAPHRINVNAVAPGII
ncbi:MAG: SDR family NAD(P)-dependent oxidoreductase, partial [Caldilineaceae bacterium]|nr:SDR family NAD(P)-dependent oxidoreductase [Caldilineaceae bacterium]